MNTPPFKLMFTVAFSPVKLFLRFNSSSIDSYLGCYGFLMSRGEMNFSRAYQIAKNMEIDIINKRNKFITENEEDKKNIKEIILKDEDKSNSINKESSMNKNKKITILQTIKPTKTYNKTII